MPDNHADMQMEYSAHNSTSVRFSAPADDEELFNPNKDESLVMDIQTWGEIGYPHFINIWVEAQEIK